jgi:hypothetical protein
MAQIIVRGNKPLFRDVSMISFAVVFGLVGFMLWQNPMHGLYAGIFFGMVFGGLFPEISKSLFFLVTMGQDLWVETPSKTKRRFLCMIIGLLFGVGIAKTLNIPFYSFRFLGFALSQIFYGFLISIILED